MKKQITIYSGIDKNGKKEPYDKITLKLGEVISIVGHTGSGKTLLISDIEQTYVKFLDTFLWTLLIS